MGLLEDAIKQHLDLKREHGADPQEVEQQAREALGPVREAAPAPDPAPFEDEPFAREEPFADEPEPAPFADEPFAEDEPFAPEEGDEGDRPGAVSADLFDAEEDEEEADEVLLGDSPGGEEPAPAEPRPDQVGDTPEDVLDATPEFLEETPEHDRLWFEQKPPRDFDF